MTEKLKLPKEVIDSGWSESIPALDFELVGGGEAGERQYQNHNAELVRKSEVEDTTTDYKHQKIGRKALFGIGDKLAA